LLPLLTFLLSLMPVLSMMVIGDDVSTTVAIVGVFLQGNIPTAIYLFIYFACREKSKRRRDLERMAAQDLN
jgi:uncharacterized membrane protein YbaN (DUF454 family)